MKKKGRIGNPKSEIRNPKSGGKAIDVYIKNTKDKEPRTNNQIGFFLRFI